MADGDQEAGALHENLTVATEAEGSAASRNAPALALSGGGFRATLFHCGTFIRLNELGLLSRLARISSVSGGSIAAGMLAVAWPRLKADGARFANLEEEVIAPLQAFCTRTIDKAAVGWGALLPGKTIGDVLADIYDEMLGGLTFAELPDAPRFVFNATNLQTGRLVRMQKNRLADYTIGEIRNPKLRVAVAVAASSAFPPVLSPVTIKAAEVGSWSSLPGAMHFGDHAFTGTLSLTDGGAYDNLGLETVDDFYPLFISDAGAPFAIDEEAGLLWPQQLMRVLDIATDQARGLRKRLLHRERKVPPDRPFAYAGIDGTPEDYPAERVLAASPSLTRNLARLRTRLNPFSDEEQGRLINWGWYMSDLAARSFVTPTVAAPTTWPRPDWPLS